MAQGPLDNAKKTIEENHLSDLVSCRLLDGIQGFRKRCRPNHNLWHGRKTHYRYPIKGNFLSRLRLLLSCHKDDFALRKYLHDHHIHIVKEKMIYDHGHYYPILDCVCEDKEQEVSTSQLYFGVNMLIDETYAAYLDFEENKYKIFFPKSISLNLLKKWNI